MTDTADTIAANKQVCHLCPPAWLPPNSGDYRPRVVKCWHRGNESLILFRHFDLPHYVCLVHRLGADPGYVPELFTDYEEGVMAFYAAERELLGYET